MKGYYISLNVAGFQVAFFPVIANVLTNREQRVVWKGKSSGWKKISAGVPQGSVLGPDFSLCISMIYLTIPPVM